MSSVTQTGENWVFIDNEFFPASEAKISVFDHGFLYGDGVFDDMIAVNSKIFRLEEHIDRLYKSTSAIGIKLDSSKQTMKENIQKTLAKTGLNAAYLRAIVTRGAGYPLLDPRVPNRPSIILIAHKEDVPSIVGGTYRTKEGAIRAIVASTRKTPSISIDARIKSLNYLNSILARLEAINAGVDEAIMLDHNDFVAEGPGSNICIVRGRALFTPETNGRLDGVTLNVILQLSQSKGYKVERANMTRYDLYTADEVFLTATALNGLTPIGEIDGRRIGVGKAGPVTRQLASSFRELMLKECSL